MKRKKYAQIMTIYDENSRFFDNAVNEALLDGWYIEKRYTVVIDKTEQWSRPLFVAELRRYIEAEEDE